MDAPRISAMRNVLLRPSRAHEQSGEERFVVIYAETIVPTYRRREIRMNDVITIVNGLRQLSDQAGRPPVHRHH